MVSVPRPVDPRPARSRCGGNSAPTLSSTRISLLHRLPPSRKQVLIANDALDALMSPVTDPTQKMHTYDRDCNTAQPPVAGQDRREVVREELHT